MVPTRYPRTDILWGSPECTHQTRASGRKRGHGEFSGGLLSTDGTDAVRKAVQQLHGEGKTASDGVGVGSVAA